MESSTAILEDARQAAKTDISAKPPPNPVEPDAKPESTSGAVAERCANNDNRQQHKRKGEYTHDRQQHGSRGGAKRSRNDGRRHPKGDMGRGEYL